MPNRVIKDSVRQSEQIDSLTWFQEVVFYRLIVTVDDFGRYYANPQIVKSTLFPMKENLAKKDVASALDKLEEVGLIQRYEVDEKQCLQFTKWRSHQQIRAVKSKFPDPQQLISNDIRCNQVKSEDINRNQLHPNTNTKSNSKTRTTDDDPDDLISIQKDHDELFDLAKRIGLPATDWNLHEIVGLYTEYGLDAVKWGISEAGRLNKISIAYIQKVAKGYGKETKKSGDDRLDDSFLTTVV